MRWHALVEDGYNFILAELSFPAETITHESQFGDLHEL